MHTKELSKLLFTHTLKFSGAESRSYLGMSRIAYCPLSLYRELIYGKDWTSEQKFYCELGYWEECKMLVKLAVIDGLDVSKLSIFPFKKFRQDLDDLCRKHKRLLGPSEEFVDFGGRLKGHSDGSWDNDLLEIKSTTEDHLPLDYQIPRSHYWQAQSYLYYGDYDRAKMIYVARDTGSMRVIHIPRNENIAELARQKAATILEAVDLGQPPACECGRCAGLPDQRDGRV